MNSMTPTYIGEIEGLQGVAHGAYIKTQESQSYYFATSEISVMIDDNAYFKYCQSYVHFFLNILSNIV